jgi:hypothetical protein
MGGLDAEAQAWMTDEIRALLRKIRGKHAGKMRTSVIRLAFASAMQLPLKPVFRLRTVCSETIWYTKWKDMPRIEAAFNACYDRVLAWADDETATVEAHFHRVRRQSVAEHAARAPEALAAVMEGEKQKGTDRIKAADTLIRLADPETAERIGPAAEGPPEVDVNLGIAVGELSDEDLVALWVNMSPGPEQAGASEGQGEVAPVEEMGGDVQEEIE